MVTSQRVPGWLGNPPLSSLSSTYVHSSSIDLSFTVHLQGVLAPQSSLLYRTQHLIAPATSETAISLTLKDLISNFFHRTSFTVYVLSS